MNELRQQIKEAIQVELDRAYGLYPKHESIEESYVVLGREFEELWEACGGFAKKHIGKHIGYEAEHWVRIEAIQVAAMARRMVGDAGIKQFIPLKKDVRIPVIEGSQRIDRYLYWIKRTVHDIDEAFLGAGFSKDYRMLSELCWRIEEFIIQMLINTRLWEEKNENDD